MREVSRPLMVRSLGLQEYEPLWRSMQDLTNKRNATTADEIWFAKHPPVFTLGLNANREHLLIPGDIPVVQTDRGGQVTYHGPGLMMVYPLVDIRRAGIGVRQLITALERAVIRLAADFSIPAECRAGAPGIYVGGKKLASVGLRIRRGASYHGMALNIDADLEPFSRINPCGYQNMEMINLRDLGVTTSLAELESRTLQYLLVELALDSRGVCYASSLMRD